MGKASRNKAVRAAERAEKGAGRESVSPADELNAAVFIVGDLFGTTPDCASAAGFLHEIAAELGHDLRPRPVSVKGFDQRTGTDIIMGPRATALLSSNEAARLEDQRPNGKDTGHLVLTSEEHSLMLDPNMRQLGHYGLQAPSIVMRVSSTVPETGEWHFSNDGLSLHYLLDEENETLLPAYERARIRFRDEARRIVVDLRAQVPIDQIVRRARDRLTA